VGLEIQVRRLFPTTDPRVVSDSERIQPPRVLANEATAAPSFGVGGISRFRSTKRSSPWRISSPSVSSPRSATDRRRMLFGGMGPDSRMALGRLRISAGFRSPHPGKPGLRARARRSVQERAKARDHGDVPPRRPAFGLHLTRRRASEPHPHLTRGDRAEGAREPGRARRGAQGLPKLAARARGTPALAPPPPPTRPLVSGRPSYFFGGVCGGDTGLAVVGLNESDLPAFARRTNALVPARTCWLACSGSWRGPRRSAKAAIVLRTHRGPVAWRNRRAARQVAL
jgi:hypothetical protein